MKRRIEEIEARLAAAKRDSLDVGMIRALKYMGSFLHNAPADIRDLLAVVKLQREALYYYQCTAFCTNCDGENNDGEIASETLEAADKILNEP